MSYHNTIIYTTIILFRSGMDNLFKCVRYCLNEVDCRRTMLLEYFGESFPASACFKTCDNCRRVGSVQCIDFTADAQRIIKCTEEFLRVGTGNKSAGTLPTLASLIKVYMNAKVKGMEKFSSIQTRCLDQKHLTRDLCERLLQLMVIDGYLSEEPKVLQTNESFILFFFFNTDNLFLLKHFLQVNASGFSSDYMGIGPKAHELTSGHTRVTLNVRLSGKGGGAAAADTTYDDIENSPEDALNTSISSTKSVSTSRKASTKRKKDTARTVIDIDSDEEEAEWLILSGGSSGNEPSGYKANKKFKAHNEAPTAPRSLLHAPNYNRSAAELHDDSYLETPMDVFDPRNIELEQNVTGYNIDKNSTTSVSKTVSATGTGTGSGRVKKPLPIRNSYALDESDDNQDDFEDMLTTERRSKAADAGRPGSSSSSSSSSDKIGKRPVGSTSATTSSTTTTTSAAAADLAKKFSMNRNQRQEFQNWLYEYRKRWPMYWNYMDNAVVANIVKEIPMTKDELAKIPKFGQVKTIRFGDHILATIWAFLAGHHLLEHFPEELRRRPGIADCPTWLDPCSEAAEEVRTNSPSAGSTTAPAPAPAPGSGSVTDTADTGGTEGGRWYKAGVGTGQRPNGALPSTSAFFTNNSSSPAPAPAVGGPIKNPYSPTDHSQLGYSKAGSSMPPPPPPPPPQSPQQESQVIDLIASPPSGPGPAYQTYTMSPYQGQGQGQGQQSSPGGPVSAQRLAYDSSSASASASGARPAAAVYAPAHTHAPAEPPLVSRRRPLQAVPPQSPSQSNSAGTELTQTSPAWMTNSSMNKPSVGGYGGGTNYAATSNTATSSNATAAAVLPSADSVYGGSKKTTAPTKRVYSMEY
jgi:superfamily II DNA helicase RecQ